MNLNEPKNDTATKVSGGQNERLVMQCDTCKHYRKNDKLQYLGLCGYPVPAYLKVVGSYGYVRPDDGKKCATYESA
jgi:hypothetical protein